MDLSRAHPNEVWKLAREGKFKTGTHGVSEGYVQANMAILPKAQALDFMIFAQRNPKPCPILDVTEPGSPHPVLMGPEADLRTDLPLYRVYKDGRLVDEPTDITSYWRDDLVAFLIGCSYSFERALVANDIRLRHWDLDVIVSMFITNIECKPAGMFYGPTVVSMRPIPYEKVVRAVQVTTRFDATHGAPLHIGDPSHIGIKDVTKPDFGTPLEIKPGEVPVFWACGVTPQVVAMHSRPELMITHSPGHMFVTAVKEEGLTVL